MTMLKKYLLLFGLFLGFMFNLKAQVPQVPAEMEFADIKLKITEAARKEIQTHVNALYRSEKYFQIKLDRVNLYFPLIEKVFEEENLPDDFKYLVIQESALISDAISSSNAVGFWQFKKTSGEEVGLRIDGTVDERLNIVSSSRAAARYLKRNNNYFGNWVYALLSYMTGAGGAQDIVKEKYFGAKKMEIDKHTHWYIIKFLAHKVAFENAIGKSPHPDLALVPYTIGANKSLKRIASEANVDHTLLEEYNKWLKRGNVPDDKIYTVVIPTVHGGEERILALNGQKENTQRQVHNLTPTFENRFSKGSDKYPIIEGEAPLSDKNAVLVKVNGRPGIIAGQNDNLLTLAEKGNVSISRFLKFNDLEANDRVIVGQVYYLKSKRGKAPEHYHVMLETENMWSVSQKYGIKLKSLFQKNRMKKGEQAKAGRVLWMRFVRPKDEPIEYKQVDNVESDDPALVVSKTIDDTIQEENTLPERSPVTNTYPVQTEVEKEDDNEVTDASVMPENDKNDNQVWVEDKQDSGTREDSDFFNTDHEIQFVETPSSAASEANKERHIVKQGETLYSISRKYGIQLGDLLYWNKLSLKDDIQPGQELKVTPPLEEVSAVTPAPSNTESEQFHVHIVTAGETMYKIARDYNVTIKDVMQWNNKEDFKVTIGERLKIKK